jgi:hypothetical protein
MPLPQVETPACAMSKSCPAIVRVPTRPAPVFAATVKETVPLPDPEALDVIVTQAALLVALQLHPAGALTPTISWTLAGELYPTAPLANV